MLPDDDIIAAIATAPGRGGIGIVRVSGKSLVDFVTALLGVLPKHRFAHYSHFCDASGAVIDHGLALYFRSPASYTGQDVLEIQGHGGPVVVRLILNRCLELGARLAEPGEFTRRAFLNGKLDLVQAEAVVDLIDASSESAARSAMRSLSGRFSEAVHKLVNDLIELRMFCESAIDFPEEELESLSVARVDARLTKLQNDLSHLLRKAEQGSLLRSGCQVVLVGDPNAGKSSLLNHLVGDERAIVTDIAGTTRDVLREQITLDGVTFHLVDTAGLRSSEDPVEKIGIDRSRAEAEKADVLLVISDCRLPLSADVKAVVTKFSAPQRTLFVRNKSDLLVGDPLPIDSAFGSSILISAKTTAGFDDLKNILLAMVGGLSLAEDVFSARERHLIALRNSQRLLIDAELEIAPELKAECFRLAQAQLSLITGEFTSDDLLGEIFSRFCIGK